MDLSKKKTYSIIFPKETLRRSNEYLEILRGNPKVGGYRLLNKLNNMDVHELSGINLLGKLIETKKPQIFAESEVFGDGSDWNQIELSLLGDISVAVPVMVFDNGNHNNPISHDPQLNGTLVYTPGALLRNGKGKKPADWDDVTDASGVFSPEGYYQLYQRRLLPVFRFVNNRAAGLRSAILTIPGLGCGQFSGPFRGQLGARLQDVLKKLLTDYGSEFLNIKAVYFDPYNECQNFRSEINGISFLVRPSVVAGNQKKSQLSHPSVLADEDDDFSKCEIFSLVAWDHVSWPGNDFYIGSRATDDGVKAAATNSMAVITGVDGKYDKFKGKYEPPMQFKNWLEVVQKLELCLWDSSVAWVPADMK